MQIHTHTYPVGPEAILLEGELRVALAVHARAVEQLHLLGEEQIWWGCEGEVSGGDDGGGGGGFEYTWWQGKTDKDVWQAGRQTGRQAGRQTRRRHALTPEAQVVLHGLVEGELEAREVAGARLFVCA